MEVAIIKRPLMPLTNSDSTSALRRAETVLAKARADCARVGATPLQCAELMLQEALLAMMVHGLSEHECTTAIKCFADETVTDWFAMVARSTERCDCAREQMRDLQHLAVRDTHPFHALVDGNGERGYRQVPAKQPGIAPTNRLKKLLVR